MAAFSTNSTRVHRAHWVIHFKVYSSGGQQRNQVQFKDILCAIFGDRGKIEQVLFLALRSAPVRNIPPIIFMVAPCINDIKRFIFQPMH